MKRKKRILFGAVDIGYRIETYTKFIDENLSDKLQAESFSKYVLPEEHYKTGYTYTCPIDKTHPLLLYLYCFGFFIFSLFRYDIFHFFSGETILTRKLRRFELATYKLFGKRVIMHFVGSDIRSEKYIAWKEKNMKEFLKGKDDFPKTLPWQKKLIADTEKYADSILVCSPDLIELIPKAVFYPVMLDLNKYLKELNEADAIRSDENEIVILHSPSNIKLKGTIYIHAILKKIAAESKNKIKLIIPADGKIESPKLYAVSRYELFKLFKEADIIVDQLIIGWYGMQTIEALAAGKQVVTYADKHLEQYLFPESPIEIANLNTLEQTIIKCIENIVNKKLKNNKDVIDWIKKYHTIENNNAALLASWDI